MLTLARNCIRLYLTKGESPFIITSEDVNMTPFEAKGWKATDKFRVFNAHGCGFNNDDLVFLYRDDNDDYPVMERQRDGMRYVCDIGRLERIEQEPQWNGEGLPPVGTVCEFKRYISVKWLPGVLSYISDYTAVITLHECDDSGRREEVGHPLAFEFRPIRTEREKAIDEMMKVVNHGLSSKELVARLYDAGYRKQ